MSEVIDLIIDDLCSRSGLQDEWENIDADIQQEIRETWEGFLEPMQWRINGLEMTIAQANESFQQIMYEASTQKEAYLIARDAILTGCDITTEQSDD